MAASATAQPLPCGMPAKHITNFVSVMPSAQPDSLRIPGTHTFQLLTQNGEAYTNPANGNMKGTFDFTGYVPVNGSSTNGVISLNHEGGSWPSAGVSLLDVRFNDTTKLWTVNNTMPVDFSAVAGTGRNCSGGITPWATVITSEETLPTADVNNDGYQDIGWNVEINPFTRVIMDYNNDGTPDKLWKMGRMSHENVVAAGDSIRVYEANDENPGYVFKFVAAVKGRLDSGNLYVLKLDSAIGKASTGMWVQVPNGTPAECNNVRAAATALGATNFASLEDVEISPRDGKIYFVSKSSGRTYRFRDNGMSISECEIYAGDINTYYPIYHNNGAAVEQWREGNDNLTFDDSGNLYVLQDGGRNHIWMIRHCHTQANPAVELFAVTPAGSEPTGMTFSPDYRFMFVSLQHPASANAILQKDAADKYVRFNKESCIVIARKEFLGKGAIPVTPTSISNVQQINGLELARVYPNPAASVLNLDIVSAAGQSASVKVYSMTGALVLSQPAALHAGNNQVSLNTAALSAGTYNVVLTTAKGTINTRFVKQ
jgi:secreted PhoX family phosphatase